MITEIREQIGQDFLYIISIVKIYIRNTHYYVNKSLKTNLCMNCFYGTIKKKKSL